MTVVDFPARDEFERTPPHDLAAERAALGGAMLSKDALADVLDVLPGAEDFYRPAHQLIYEAITALHERGEPVDAVTVGAELTRTGDIAKIRDDLLYLHTLIEAVPAAANAGYYARLVRKLAAFRRAIAAGTRITQLGYEAESDPAELADRAGELLDEATRTVTRNGAVPVAELATTLLMSLEAGPGDVPGITLPWHDLGAHIPGLRAGEVTVVGGRPGAGKSVVLLCIAAHAALRLRANVLAVTLEMSCAEYMERLYACEGGVELDHIRKHQLTDRDWDRLQKAHAEFQAADTLAVHDGPDMSVHGIRAELRAMRRAGKAAELVIVDYLQLVTASGRRTENRQAEVSEISRAVKLLAKEFAVPVVIGAQLNRGPEQRTEHRPVLADLRESGSIENDADIVILLHRDEAYERESPRAGEIDLIVAKNRQGSQGYATAAFQGHYARVWDMARDWSPSGALGETGQA